MTTATVDDELYNDEGDSFPIQFDLSVVEVGRGDSGYEWILAKTKVKFVESETEDLAFNIDGIMNFEMVSESGDIYSGDIVGTTEPDFSFEMYVGSEKEPNKAR